MVDLTITDHALKLCGTDRDALAKLVAETGESENMAIQTAIVNWAEMTDARRRASAKFHAKRQAEGSRKVTYWATPDMLEIINRLAAELGSKDKALEAIVLAYGRLVAKSVKTPPVSEKTGLAGGSKAKPRTFAKKAAISITNRDGLPTKFQGVDIAKGETVTFGPIPEKPGSRLDKSSKPRSKP